MGEYVLSSRLTTLREMVRNGFENAPAQVQGFVMRVLQPENRHLSEAPLFRERTTDECLESVRFDGYPALARAGYNLAYPTETLIDPDVADRFLQCVERQSDRPAAKQAELAGDAVALLGIADGATRDRSGWGAGSRKTGNGKEVGSELVGGTRRI